MRILAIVAFTIGFVASAHAAPVVKVAKPKTKFRLKAAKAKELKVRPVKPAQKAELHQQRPKTIVQNWTTGNGRDHRVVFLHGLGGVPDGPMINGIVRSLHKQGVSATFKAPLLREVKMNAQGEIIKEKVQTMTEQLRHAREVIRSQPGKIVLFGHSFGAKASLLLAKEFPEKISALIIIAPSVKMLHAYWKRISGKKGLAGNHEMQTVLTTYQGKLEAKLEATVDPVQRTNLKEAIKYNSIMHDLVSYNEAAMETNIPVPTLAFHGVRDQAVSIHYVQRFADANSKVKLVRYENHDHHLDGPSRHDTAKTLTDVATKVNRFLEVHAK